MKSNFKVKIIGGKLVQVPDFDYAKEYENANFRQKSGHQRKPECYEILPQANQAVTAKYSPRKLEPIASHDINGGKVYRSMSYKGRRFSNEYGPIIGKPMPQIASSNRGNIVQSTLAMEQRLSNQFEAERNKHRAQQQLYSSSLEPGPTADIDRVLITGPSCENVKSNIKMNEVEADDAALSKQVADCLEHTNKQKLAYALKAMKRLDVTGTGYITVREFRDILLMYQVFIIGGALEKLIEKYKSNGGKINYSRLWNFVSKSYDMMQGSPYLKVPVMEETDEQRTLRETTINVQKSLRAFAEEHQETYDFDEIEKSFRNCDRTGTSLMHENEMKIICSHYLPLDFKDIEVLLRECDPQKNGWINYEKFLTILKNAQPTYLPPVDKLTRRGTFTMDDTDTAILIPSLKSSSDYKLPVTKEHNNVGKEEKPMRIRDESVTSPRRRWYESEESWKKRKRREAREYIRQKSPTRRPAARKKWEHPNQTNRNRDSAKQDSLAPTDSDYFASYCDTGSERSRIQSGGK